MKKSLAAVLALMISISGMAFSINGTAYAATDKTGHMSFSIKPEMNALVLRWKKADDVSGYDIYRKDVTKALSREDPAIKLKQYKRIEQLPGTKSSFRDRDVRRGHYYAYVIKAFKKENGIKKVVSSSYISGNIQYDCPGLDRPVLLNAGYGENYTNDLDGLYLYVDHYAGVEPSSAAVYRKEKGSKGYKRVKVQKVEGDSLSVLKDTTVKPGKIYYYRIKTAAKYNGKRFYSQWSEAVRIPNVRFKGRFTVKDVSGASGDELVLKMTADKYNGRMKFRRALVYDGTYDEDGDIRLKEVSRDNKTWTKFKAGKWSIDAGETFYIKLSGKDLSSLRSLTFEEGAVKYDGPGKGEGVLTIDFRKGKGTVYQNFD